jgi:hypothetical protein
VRETLGQDVPDLLIRREAAKGFLRESEAAIDGDLENATTGLAQADAGRRAGFLDQAPRRDRTRLISSHPAVFNFHVHR